MELSQTNLFDLKEVKAPLPFNGSEVSKKIATAYIKGVAAEKPANNPTIESSLKRIFPEREEENVIQKTRRIMGDGVKDLSDEELKPFVTEFQYLISAWIDGFEKQIFENKTLKELLKED